MGQSRFTTGEDVRKMAVRAGLQGNWWEDMRVDSTKTTRTDTEISNVWTFNFKGRGQIGNAAGGVVWGYNSTTSIPATQASNTVTIESTNGGDNQDVLIVGLDGDNIVIENNTLTNTTPVTLDNNFTSIIFVKVFDSFNAGSVIVKSAASTGMAFVQAGDAISNMCWQLVPTGYTLVVYDININSDVANTLPLSLNWGRDGVNYAELTGLDKIANDAPLTWKEGETFLIAGSQNLASNHYINCLGLLIRNSE